MADEDTSSSSEGEETEESELQDDDDSQPGPGAENAEGEESGESEEKPVPVKRFKQVYGKYKQYKAGYESTQQELATLRAQLANGQKKTGEDGAQDEEKELTPAQKKAIDRVLRQSHPQLFQKMEQLERREQASEAAMIARAERDVTKMAQDAHFAADEESLATLAEMVGNRIRDDEQLAAMWEARDPLCLELAFKKVQKQLEAFQRKSNGQALQKGKRLAKLPTAPLGGTTTSTPKPESKNKGKGITKDVHDDAWAVLQNHMQQE